MSLLNRTIDSVGWTTLARVCQQGFQFGLSVLLMRLLGPTTFGLIGMVLVFSGFAAIFSELGFSTALIQRKNLLEEHRSTAFWLNLILAVVIAAGLFFAAPFIANFYNEPQLVTLTPWLALNFIVITPGTVPRALLQKAMRFDVLAKIDIASVVLSGIVSAAFALRGAGVWSLVAQVLTNGAVSSTLLLGFGSWRPKLIWSGPALRELLHVGSGMTGFNVINYWARSADTMLIGKFIGSEALGLYSRAYSLMLLPLTQVVSVLAPVMFPALSSIQGDKERVRRSYLRAMRLLTFITFPMMLGLIAVADPFITVLFGEKWIGVIPLVRILAIVGMTQTLCNPTGWIYTSQGRTDLMFWWGIGGSGSLVAAIVIGISFGTLESVAVAYLIGNLTITVPCILIPGKLIGMKVRDVWHAVRANLACAAGMALMVVAIEQWFEPHLSTAVRLGVDVLIGVVAYIGLGLLLKLEALRELALVVERFIPHRRANQPKGT